MALSEQEQRLLDEMERNLYQNDADFLVEGNGGVTAAFGHKKRTDLAAGPSQKVVGGWLLAVAVLAALPAVVDRIHETAAPSRLLRRLGAGVGHRPQRSR